MADSEHTPAVRHPLRLLPSKFQVSAPDDAMAPRVRAGTNVEFDTTLTPRDGDGVLVRRSDDEFYFRLYRDTFDGCFEAVALNPHYRHSCFDSKYEPELQVVAVMTGIYVRWAQKDGPNALTDADSLRLAVYAWKRAASEAEQAGTAFSRFDCHAHLGLGRRLQ